MNHAMKAISKFCSVAFSTVALSALTAGCGDDDSGGPTTEADRAGVGAQCAEDMDCPEPLVCLKQFKGGYCGIQDCAGDVDCPVGSACVEHEDNSNYCFRICVDKSECNVNRTAELASNCSSSITFVDSGNHKACVPPSN
jgi:hypothetical protein